MWQARNGELDLVRLIQSPCPNCLLNLKRLHSSRCLPGVQSALNNNKLFSLEIPKTLGLFDSGKLTFSIYYIQSSGGLSTTVVSSAALGPCLEVRLPY